MRTCPKGKTLRKSYKRKSYRRSSGVRVSGSNVPSSCIKDRGSRGKGKKIFKNLRVGSLTNLGYSVSSPKTSRRRSLKKAVKEYGKSSTIKKLNVIAVYNKRVSPKTTKTARSDMEYVRSI